MPISDSTLCKWEFTSSVDKTCLLGETSYIARWKEGQQEGRGEDVWRPKANIIWDKIYFQTLGRKPIF